MVSSADAPWHGILLEQYRDSNSVHEGVYLGQHTLFLQLTPVVLDLRVGDESPFDGPVNAGVLHFIPSRQPLSVRGRQKGDFVSLSLDGATLASAFPGVDLAGPMDFRPRLAFWDPTLRDLVLALRDEAAAGYPGGRLFGDSLATAIAARLFPPEDSSTPGRRGTCHVLSPSHMRKISDFVHSHLAEEISLRQLADLCQLSPYHFSRLFRRSAGLPPHQYILQCRVQRARSLLSMGDRPVADVAAQTGFCDQSHLGLHFKRAYGVSPGDFLRRTRLR